MRIVMIGHGMVGHRFLENLAKKATVAHEVIVLAEEPRPAYDRVQLSAFFSGNTADVMVNAPDLIAWNRIRDKLTKTSGITNLQIKSFSAGRAHASLDYQGDIESIKKSMDARGLTVVINGANWQVSEKQ